MKSSASSVCQTAGSRGRKGSELRSSSWQLLLCLLVLVLSPVPKAEAAWSPMAVTVAGRLDNIGNVTGTAGTSLLTSPWSICADYDAADVTDASFMVSASKNFYSFNRYSTQLSYWFGAGSSATGALDAVSLTNAYACVSVPPATIVSGSTSTIYYVTGSGKVWWISGGQVFSASVSTTTTFYAVTVYSTNLYLFSAESKLYRCDISSVSVVPSQCSDITPTTGSMTSSTSTVLHRGIAVSSSGIFLATGTGIFWYQLSGTFVASLTTLPMVDVHFTRNTASADQDATPTLIGATSTAVYSISTAGSTLAATVIAGVESSTTCTNVDSATNPTFCNIGRIFPLSADTIYMSFYQNSVLRAIVVPNTTLSTSIARTPFPVGFVDESCAVPMLLTGMDYEISFSTSINYPFISVDTTSLAVSDTTWNTAFSVDVSERYYEATTTPNLLAATPYSSTLYALDTYYNRTNQLVFSDANLLPTCNISKMLNIEQSVTADARTALRYSLIYAAPARTLTVSGNPNITFIKLLMPSPFGTYIASSAFTTNTTTATRLATVKFNETILAAVVANYPSDRQYEIIFAGSQYRFDTLTASQMQEARWYLLDLIYKRLAVCAAQTGDAEDGGNSAYTNPSGELYSNCTPHVGLTNITNVATSGSQYGTYDVQIFVPETYNYSFNVTRCLETGNWSDMSSWISNATRKTSQRKCDTGCIVGIAVACAVVAAILIIVVVVLTSKRRRLATVVAPAATAEPKFASTLDLDDEEATQNPLQG